MTPLGWVLLGVLLVLGAWCAAGLLVDGVRWLLSAGAAGPHTRHTATGRRASQGAKRRPPEGVDGTGAGGYLLAFPLAAISATPNMSAFVGGLQLEIFAALLIVGGLYTVSFIRRHLGA